MRSLLARHLIYPTHEWLMGRSTVHYWRELERSQWTSPAELRSCQQRKLRLLLQHAIDHIPFYRERIVQSGLDLHTPDLLAELQRIPTLDKQQIRMHLDELVWHDSPGGVYPLSTGGSSGEPLSFYIDRRRQAYDQAARMRTHRWFDVNFGDHEVYLWGSPIEHTQTDTIRRVRDWLTNHHLLNAFNMSPDRMDRYLDLIKSIRPSCLFGYPSSIALLVEHAQRRGRPFPNSRLRAVFVTGEVCYAHHRKTIGECLGVPVVDGYGSREAGFIAHECPNRSMHLTAENVIVEIIKNEQPVPDGEVGEIVVTHLDAYGMPFIRYRTGDIGRLKPGRCACGRGLPMMDVVHGRATDFLYLRDGSIKHALAIIYPLRDMKGIKQFRVKQHADYSITVDVVADDTLPTGRRNGNRTNHAVTCEAVARCVFPVLGDDIDLDVRVRSNIPATKSGKFRYVTSDVKPISADTAKEIGHAV